MDTIRREIKVLMVRQGWTVEDVGNILGIKRSQASARINGGAKMDVEDVEKLAVKAAKTLKISFE